MTLLIIVNEITFILLLWNIFILKRRVFYVAIEPFIFVNRYLLSFLIRKLVELNKVQHIDTLFSDRLRFGEVAPGYQEYNEIELLLQKAYDVIKKERIYEDIEYSYAIEKINIREIKRKLIQLVKIKYILDKLNTSNPKYTLLGTTEEDIALFNLCFPDKKMDNKLASYTPLLYKISNFLNSILVFIGICSYLILKLRFKTKKKRFVLVYDFHIEPISFISSSNHSNPDIALYSVKSKTDLLILFRHSIPKKLLNDITNKLNGVHYTSRSDGAVTIMQFIKLLIELFKDINTLYFRFSDVQSQLFEEIILLPYRKARICAFLGKYEIKAFWGRDEYAPEHIVRTSLLRKKNVKSIGMHHGLPVPGVTSIWRHIDFDIFFVFGSHVYKKIGHCWSKNMKVIPVGSLHGLKFLQQLKSSIKNRPKDIVFFQSPQNKKWEYIYKELFKVASFFSDRTLYIKPKLGPTKRVQQFYNELETLKDKPSNIEVYTGSPYELMLKVSYAITAGSSLAAEALQFKLPTFVFDVDPSLQYFYYRDFPDMCVKTAEEIIEWINDIENNKRSYPFEKFRELINMEENFDFYKTIHDIVYY